MTFSFETQPIASIPLSMGSSDKVVYVDDTRVPLDTVVDAFQDGATPEEIHCQYPSLSLESIYAVLGYYLGHRPEVDAYLVERREQAATIRRQNEERFPPDGIRERLLARRHVRQEQHQSMLRFLDLTPFASYRFMTIVRSRMMRQFGSSRCERH